MFAGRSAYTSGTFFPRVVQAARRRALGWHCRYIEEHSMSESKRPEGAGRATKVSRRDFAKTSVAAGAAAVALPGAVRAEAVRGGVKAAGAAPNRTASAAASRPPAGRLAPPPDVVGYGGTGAAAPAALHGAAARRYTSGWQPGTTIPGEYYFEPEHYARDEEFLRENQWIYADVTSRIPNAGDYFVFQFGRSDSVIVVRNSEGKINAFHNVCRHRGSRLCRHDADAVPEDPRLSVKQLGEDGNSPVFRCPYHAWTYDTDGNLIYAYGMQDDFDPAENGLVPCHLRVVEGQIFVHLTQASDPPDFDEQVADDIGPILRYYGAGDLKVAARERYDIHANWKLALENFQECYHCGPSHKSLTTAHHWDEEMTPEQRAEHSSRVSEWIKLEGKRIIGAGDGMGAAAEQAEYRESFGGQLNPGFMTGSMDGKPVGPLLPNITEWTYGTRIAGTRFFAFYAQCYDDHIGIARFTPRDAEFTDCEIIWLVHPDAVEGRDYDPDNVKALWHVTIQEDIWVVENNHQGVRSGAYGAGRYSDSEAYPRSFMKWYMEEMVDPA